MSEESSVVLDARDAAADLLPASSPPKDRLDVTFAFTAEVLAAAEGRIASPGLALLDAVPLPDSMQWAVRTTSSSSSVPVSC